MLTGGGRAVLEVATTEMRQGDFWVRFHEFGEGWCRLMDRGRTESYPGLMTQQEWENTFLSSRLKVNRCVNILPRGIFLAWNVGLRPLFPLLKRMSRFIPASELQPVREEWVQTWCELLLPLLIAPEVLVEEGVEPIRLHYVLTK